MEILDWLNNWYASHCDGDWEHMYMIKIATIDNPGWSVKIDLAETELENIKIEWSLVAKSENDWYGIKIENSVYDAAGDPNKLQLLLEKFKEIVENNP